MKRSWNFYSVGDIYHGTFINTEPCTAEEALEFCKLSMGVKINRVY